MSEPLLIAVISTSAVIVSSIVQALLTERAASKQHQRAMETARSEERKKSDSDHRERLRLAISDALYLLDPDVSPTASKESIVKAALTLNILLDRADITQIELNVCCSKLAAIATGYIRSDEAFALHNQALNLANAVVLQKPYNSSGKKQIDLKPPL